MLEDGKLAILLMDTLKTQKKSQFIGFNPGPITLKHGAGKSFFQDGSLRMSANYDNGAMVENS